MKSKRCPKKPVDFLTRAESEAVLSGPDQATWSGRRDRTLLLVALQTGLRVSKLIGLRCLCFCDFDAGSGQTRRNGNSTLGGRAFDFWKAGQESAAWAYELVRRACPKKKRPPFYLLRSHASWEIQGALAKESKQLLITNSIPTDRCHPGWFHPADSYNLFADEKHVVAAFLSAFRTEREKRGILKKRAKRHFSWHLVEVFDIWKNRWDGFDLNAPADEKAAWSESIRKQKEDACKRGKACLPAFERAHAQIRATGGLRWNPKHAKEIEHYLNPETRETFAGPSIGSLPVFLCYFDGTIREELLREFGPSLPG